MISRSSRLRARKLGMLDVIDYRDAVLRVDDVEVILL